MVTRFLHCRSGATAIEYGLICAVIVLVMVGGLTILSQSVGNSYNNTNQAVGKAMNK